MLSNGFDKPLHLKRKPSRVLAIYLVLTHGLALTALLQPLAITVLIHAMLYVCLFTSSAYQVVYFRRQSDDQYHWVWHSSGVWQYGMEEQVFRLLSARSIQTAWFVLVTLINSENQKRKILIVRDQLDANTFRRLRVRHKLHHDEAVASKEEAA